MNEVQLYWSDASIGFIPADYTGPFPSDLLTAEDKANREVSYEEKDRFFANYETSTWVFDQVTHLFIFTAIIPDWAEILSKDAKFNLGDTDYLVAYDVLPNLNEDVTSQLLAYRGYLVRVMLKTEDIGDSQKLKTIDEF